MIEIRNVSKSFGDICAVDSVTAGIGNGQIFGLIGTNGAGKSTLLRLMAGVLKADEGEILIDGQEEEFQKLYEFNRRIGLPVSFHEMGITLEDLRKVAERITRDEDLEHYPYPVNVDMIMKAAERLA